MGGRSDTQPLNFGTIGPACSGTRRATIMQSYDFRRDAPVLKVPVYFMLGEYDVNGTALSVDYFNRLRAPHKRLYIFPKGAHGEIFAQPERFTDIMVDTVLRETRQ